MNRNNGLILFLLSIGSVMLLFGIIIELVALLVRIKISVWSWMLLVGIIAFIGSLIALMTSTKIALHKLGATLIFEPQTPEERWLFDVIEELSAQVGISVPQIASFESKELNIFSMGANMNESTVFISSGALNTMNHDDLKAMLAHECAHISNGDMVTMILLQGVVNIFTSFIPRYLFCRIFSLKPTQLKESASYRRTVYLMNALFTLFSSKLANKFSKAREYRADNQASDLVGKEKILVLLTHLEDSQPTILDESISSSGIIGDALNTHPELRERKAAL